MDADVSLAERQNENMPESTSINEQPFRPDNAPGAEPNKPPGTVPILIQNQFAQEPTYFTRPNRYFGPDSTWLSWTEPERNTALALDRLRSQNLSLHLFNAFELKQQHRQGPSASSSQNRRRKGKDKARSRDASSSESTTLDIPRSWTAWPLPPDHVPREWETAPLQPGSLAKGGRRQKASAELEACLIAKATQLAREKFDGRPWEDKTATSQNHISNDRELPRPAPSDHVEESDAAETLESDSDTESALFVSQPLDLDRDSSPPLTTTTAHKDPNADEEGRPVVLADDDQARALLLPAVRHILSQVDALLTSLHQARQAYATVKVSADRDENSVSATDADHQTENPPGHHDRGRSRSRKRKRSPSHSLSAHSPSISTDRSQRKGHLHPNLRDWSDVIGMAALTGWDPSIISRASERCANLFGQDMLLRTFYTGNPATKQKSYFTEQHALQSSSSTSPSPPPHAASPNIKTRLRLCPFPQCPHHHRPFHKSYHLQRHLDTIHKNIPIPSPPPPPPIETHAVPSTQPTCPIPTCPRHYRPFSAPKRMYEHVRSQHRDVDADALKRLETHRRGGERRGRWRDESRRAEVARRSRSGRSETRSAEGGVSPAPSGD